jgi:hypothetical protein
MLTLSAEVLRDMSVGEVKSVMQAYGLGWAGCLEKADLITVLQGLVERLLQLDHVAAPRPPCPRSPYT